MDESLIPSGIVIVPSDDVLGDMTGGSSLTYTDEDGNVYWYFLLDVGVLDDEEYVLS